MTSIELLPQILSLSDRDQLMIVEAIRNHLAGALAPIGDAEFKTELLRRSEDARLHPDDESSLGDTMKRLRSIR